MKSILIEITKPEEKLKYKIKTSEEIEFLDIYGKEKNEKLYEIYMKAKNLKPLPNLDKPYRQLSNLISSIDLGYHKGAAYYNVKYAIYENIKNKYINLLEVENQSKVISYHDTEFFNKFLKKNKEYKILIAYPTLVVSSVENFILYRNLNSPHIAYNDKIIFAELRDYVTNQYKVTSEELSDNFKNLYPNVDYQIIEGKEKQINVNIGKLNFIDFSAVLFEWIKKSLTSYRSSFPTFKMLIFALENLAINGLLRFQVYRLDICLFLDIITIFSKYFKKTYIFKSSISKAIYDYKYIIFENFIGIEEKDLQDIKDIYQEIIKIKEDVKINRILENKLNLDEYNLFNDQDLVNKIEIWEKMIFSYQFFENNDQQSIDNLMLEQLIRSIQWLKDNKITYNSQFNKISNILLKNSEIEKNYYFEEINLKEEKEKNEYNFEIFKYNIIFLKTLDIYKFKKINKLTNPFFLTNTENILEKILELIEVKEGKKIKIDQINNNLNFLEKKENKIFELNIIQEAKNFKDIEEYITKNYKKFYIFKPFSDIYSSNFFIICLNYKKNYRKEKINLLNYLDDLFYLLNKYINYVLFYYHNDIILKKNIEELNKIQKKLSK